MTLQNTWVLDWVHRLEREGILRLSAREGFIKEGRGAVRVDALDILSYNSTYCYLPRATWAGLRLEESQRAPLLDAIDTYNPLSQVLVVVFSTVDHGLIEMTVCWIPLTTF